MKKYLVLLAVLCIVVGLVAMAPTPKRAVANPSPAQHYRDVFYTEDFESGATGWTHYDGAVSPNNWHIYNNGDAQGDVWWMGDETGNGGYHDHQYLVLDTPVIPIATGSSTLTFKMRHGLEEPGASGEYDGWDSFNIRISTNSGVTYTVIPGTVITPVYDFANSYAFGSEHGEGLGVPAWGGVRPWTVVTVDLAQYLVSGAANVKIRFAFASDPAYNTDDDPGLFGVMVDDIALAGFSNNGVNNGQLSWTSLVPTAGDFWHLATDAAAPSPTHIMSSMNASGTYVPYMLNYLESPDIVLPADATQIVADFQLKGSFTDSGTFPDVDYFGWEVYHGGQWHYMSNPYDDPDGMNYVFSSAPDTWASMVNSYTLDGDITDFAGDTVRFRWYFQSNDDVSGTPLQIDDFQIFSVSAAPAPVNLVYPINGQEDLPYTGFIFDWASSSLGAAPEYYTICIDADDANLQPGDFFAPTYSLEIVPVLVDTLWYLYTSCNSNNIPDFDMGPGQQWYWTVVASVTDQPDAYSEIWRFDTVSAAEVITTFPWTEDFEEAGALPAGWTIGNVDNDAVTWAPYGPTTTYAHSPSYAMRHLYGDAVPEPGQNGWLVSPPIQLPAEGVGVLSFWSYNQYPSYTVHNGVWINTDPNPLDPYWEQVWEQTDLTTQAWVQKTIDVSAYNGNIIYVAFKYTGFDANAWYIDDVNMAFYTSDVLPPVLSNHLPVINTPREDLTWPVSVNVADDVVFNNPITAVNMYWSLDAGVNWSAAIPMTLTTGTTYEGTLPAQPLGSTVTYKFEAFDSLNNMASATYSYSVDDPVWMWYDTGGTGYTGFASYNWGPAVWYENPFYGTGTAVKLLGSDGALHNATTGNGTTTAHMHVYGEDFEGNLTELMTPIDVVFTHRTYRTVDLSAYDIQITTPYFWISYEDLGTNRYFLYDATYDYTSPLFLFIGGDLYTSASTGEWCIGAYVQTGDPALYFPPEVSIVQNLSGNPELSWDALSGAQSYNVYGCNDPYAEWPTGWTLLQGGLATPTYTYTGTETMQFFKVVGSTEAGARTTALAPGRRTFSAPQITMLPQQFKADLVEKLRK